MKSQKELRRLHDSKKITLTNKDVARIKKEATEEAVRIAGIADAWILRSKYGFGEKRMREFMAHKRDLIDSLNKGYITLKDIEKQLKKETGI